MRVFVTGATGFVGSAVVRELLSCGHEVLALVRDQQGAAAVAAAGAAAHLGSLDDTASLHRGAASSDAVIHTAFDHDFSRFADNCERDRRAVLALGAALAGSDRRLVVTAGVAMIAHGKVVTENDLAPPPGADYPRASEQTAMKLLDDGVHAVTVRLPPSVHGAGDHGFVPMLIDLARQHRRAAYSGDGASQWSAVHRLDAARLFRLAVEQGVAGARYHAVAEEGVTQQAIADVIGARLHLPAQAVDHAAADEHFGWFRLFAGMDVPASSAITRAALGWVPEQATLLNDLRSEQYRFD